VIYAATALMGDVYRSPDGGATWSLIRSGLPVSSAHSLWSDPTSPDTIYLGTASQGVYVKASGGTTWSAANTGAISTDVRAFSYHPTIPGGGGRWIGTTFGVYYFATGQWNAGSYNLTNPSATSLVRTQVDGADTLAMGTTNKGAFYLSATGPTWVQASGIPTNAQITLAVSTLANASTNVVYAGGTDFTSMQGLWKSTDGGKTYALTTFTNMPAIAIAVKPGSAVVWTAGIFGGVARSPDGGATWGYGSAGLGTRCSTFYYAGYGNETIFCGGGFGGVWRSDTGGVP
jgi:hypothetical protein